ncbi:MAG: hypothetical protein F6K00_34230 [Leptolyngbya sp. SIOISBB]|nr:hypothetical protein [Leptolyngbya sp. SIOISBB]
MILSRRKAHFYLWMGLAGLLPIAFLAALIWRPLIPTVDEAADELFAAANFPSAATETVMGSETVSVNGVAVHLTTAETAGSEQILMIKPTQPLQFSDTLVYWSPSDTAPETVDEDATLLGQLSGTSARQFIVIPEMQAGSGYLLFYSHGQDTAIAAIPLPSSLFP